MTITLQQLVDAAAARSAAEQRVLPRSELRARLDGDASARTPGRLREALGGATMCVIAEVKGASPVDGSIRKGYEPATIARDYARAGAAAISVLTEPEYFGGSLAALEAVAAAVPVPVLRKDFIVDEYQIDQAALAGAAAVLLIADVLEPERLAELVRYSASLGLDALVEAHEPELIAVAAAAGSAIVGVNNRNLATMRVDWRYSLEVANRLPDGVVAVSESGVSNREQLSSLRAAGYDAALIGSALMRADDPGAALSGLLQEVD